MDAAVGLVPLILTVDPSGGADAAMLAWRKPTVVKRALPTPIASTTVSAVSPVSAVAMMTEVQIVSVVGVADRGGYDA